MHFLIVLKKRRQKVGEFFLTKCRANLMLINYWNIVCVCVYIFLVCVFTEVDNLVYGGWLGKQEEVEFVAMALMTS